MKKNNKPQLDDKQLRLMLVSEDRSELHMKGDVEQCILFGDVELKAGDMLQKKKPVIH